MRRSNRHTTCAARKSRLRTCDNDAAKRMGRAVKCPPCLAQTQDWEGGDPDCRNVSPACGFGTPALPINFEGKDIVRAAFLAAAVHAGREDIFERDVSGLLRGEQLFPMTVSVHAHSLCRIRYLTKQGRDAHRGRCPYCSSHSARDHWSARPRIVRCRPRPPKTTQTRHRRIARKGCRSCRSEEQVALPKAILPGRSGRPARPKRSLRPPPRNRPRSTMLAVSCARPSSSTKTECRRSDSRRYLPCRFLLRLVRPPWQTQPRQPLACRPSMCRWPWRGWSAPPQPPASRIFARRKRLSLPTIRRVVIARREQTARKQREERCPTATARRQSMK